MDNHLTDFFRTIIQQSGSYDIANSEFKRILAEDSDLKDEYKEWCDEMGYTERDGFKSFCEELLNDQDSIWDTLNDYDE